jgi:hypothetical protein
MPYIVLFDNAYTGAQEATGPFPTLEAAKAAAAVDGGKVLPLTGKAYTAMGPLAEVTPGDGIGPVLHELGLLPEEALYKISFAIDGGLKIKVNEGAWTPPLGKVK